MILAAPLAAAMAPRRSQAASVLEQLADAPQQLQTPIAALDGLLTPNDQFFVRSHFGPPMLDRSRRVTVSGKVTRPGDFTLQALEALGPKTVTAVLQCAGNGRAFLSPSVPGVQWQHGAMGQAQWTGVSLATLLQHVGLEPKAAHVHLVGADRAPKAAVPGFIRSIPLEKALHPDTLIAWRMNSALLSLEHGAPFRVVVPGWAGDHWLKWLTHVEVSEEEHPGFFVQKAYRIPPKPVAPGTKVPPEQMEPVTVMPVKSLVTWPLEGARLRSGALEVRGLAFSGQAPIRQVEISLDGGASWQAARLEGARGVGRWQLFKLKVLAKPGAMQLLARATDDTGATQPEQGVWNPSGYFWNAWHRVSWSVT